MDEENKNQEENGDSKDSKFSIAKRIRLAGIIYIALAICIVTVMVISINSVSNTDSIRLPDVSLPEVSSPSIENPNNNPHKKPDVPVNAEQSDVPADTSEAKEARPVYTRPAQGEIIKGYHMTSLVYSMTMKDHRTHSGVDIAGKTGDSVKCYADGVVSAIRNDDFMGKTVEITHKYGLISVYQNLSATLPDNVYIGAEVLSGDIIGAIGETAIAESADKPHLHFELLLDNENIDCENEIKDID